MSGESSECRVGRDTVCDTLKVPLICGRGEPHALVVGTRAMADIDKWAPEARGDSDTATWKSEGIFGMVVVPTTEMPDALFAVTREEYDKVLEWLKGK